jgi:hypothetical protein
MSESAPIKPFKMSEIKSKLLQPALTSHFICEFFPPSGVQQFLRERDSAGFKGGEYTGNTQELIRISCSDASLPGSSIMTHEINNDYTGVTERHAYRRSYDDRADFSFIVDRNYFVIDYFENWISYVVGENLLTETNEQTLSQIQRTYNYRVNFPNNYKSDNLFITKFERDYGDTRIDPNNQINRPLTYQFINSYPISITTMPVSYDSSSLLKCTVSFTYSRYLLSRNPAQFTPQNEEPIQPTPRTLAEQTRQSQQLNTGRINTQGQAGPSIPPNAA